VVLTGPPSCTRLAALAAAAEAGAWEAALVAWRAAAGAAAGEAGLPTFCVRAWRRATSDKVKHGFNHVQVGPRVLTLPQ
jgi:hypothetical protein